MTFTSDEEWRAARDADDTAIHPADCRCPDCKRDEATA